MKAHYIVVEGLEGAGKTSAITFIIDTLKSFGIQNIQHVREPGGTPIAESLREIIKAEHKDETVTPITELLLVYAARCQLIENVVKKSLAKDIWVVSDRHDLSSRAYQGGGREIDDAVLNPIRHAVLGDFRPDLTLYLDIDPEQGLQRVRGRGELDRIEQEDLAFFVRTREKYLEIARQEKDIVIIDASRTLAEVQNMLREALESHYA